MKQSDALLWIGFIEQPRKFLNAMAHKDKIEQTDVFH